MDLGLSLIFGIMGIIGALFVYFVFSQKYTRSGAKIFVKICPA
jgi:hypothetical protein